MDAGHNGNRNKGEKKKKYKQTDTLLREKEGGEIDFNGEQLEGSDTAEAGLCAASC